MWNAGGVYALVKNVHLNILIGAASLLANANASAAGGGGGAGEGGGARARSSSMLALSNVATFPSKNSTFELSLSI